jgi:hypothetical protein
MSQLAEQLPRQRHAGQRYRIELLALDGDTPAHVRLRQALKTLLRTFRLRCVSVEALEDLPPASGKRA